MSTKIGVISEGPIDHVLLPPLLSHIARTDAGYNWPIMAGDVTEPFNIRKRGHGGVLETVKTLVEFLTKDSLGYSFVVIVLDRRTKEVQQEIRKLVAGNAGFIFGIAIEEIEAWWLGDRTNTLAWSGFTPETLPACRYKLRDSKGRLVYAAEKDPEPKNTLDEITDALGSWNTVAVTGTLNSPASLPTTTGHRTLDSTKSPLSAPMGLASSGSRLVRASARAVNVSDCGTHKWNDSEFSTNPKFDSDLLRLDR